MPQSSLKWLNMPFCDVMRSLKVQLLFAFHHAEVPPFINDIMYNTTQEICTRKRIFLVLLWLDFHHLHPHPPRFPLNIKTVFPGMGFPYKDKAVIRPSYIYNGSPYTHKTTYQFHWDGPRGPSHYKYVVLPV